MAVKGLIQKFLCFRKNNLKPLTHFFAESGVLNDISRGLILKNKEISYRQLIFMIKGRRCYKIIHEMCAGQAINTF